MIIFYDDTCPLCQRMIGKVQERDKEKIFRYLPLRSDEAKEQLPEKLRKGDTVVLQDGSGKLWVRSQACFRILHLLGVKGAGILSHIAPLNAFYRVIAHSRHLFR